MGNYALWYFGINAKNGSYTTRSDATPKDLKNRNFGYAIALEVSEGRDVPQSGDTYTDGYNDGKVLGEWVDPKLSGIDGRDYLVEIPFYRKGTPEHPKNPKDYSRGVDYWKGWIDGVYYNTGGGQVGFYWCLESPRPITGEYITEADLDTISNYVKTSLSQVLHWIPALNGRTPSQLDQFTDIKSVAKYFNFVFCQPNYYERCKMNDNTTDYTYQELVEVVNWVYDAAPNTWIEMEADRSVLGEIENCRCIKTECDCSLSSCVDYACDYVRAEKDVTGSVWAQRAYYFSTELAVIDTVRNQCSDW